MVKWTEAAGGSWWGADHRGDDRTRCEDVGFLSPPLYSSFGFISERGADSDTPRVKKQEMKQKRKAEGGNIGLPH